jgi:hypothetical protein
MAASFGARVAMAEERYMGGTCVNVGCVPKKLFAYAAHVQGSPGCGRLRLEDEPPAVSTGRPWSPTRTRKSNA